MELLVNQDLDLDPEPLVINCNASEGLLNSNYKAVANANFKSSVEGSLYSRRQLGRNFQFSTINHASAILKLLIFGVILLSIF